MNCPKSSGARCAPAGKPHVTAKPKEADNNEKQKEKQSFRADRLRDDDTRRDPGGEPHDTIVPGDVNGDGKVNARDVTAIMKHMIGAAPKGFIEAAADVNGDGKVNSRDVVAVMKAIIA